MNKKVLFVVENDYFPRDIRVYNECKTMVNAGSRCYVLAPKQKKSKFLETIDGEIKCYRFPHLEAKRTLTIFPEYFIAGFWIGILVPIIVLLKRIRIVHVANPPDFIIPIISWLKLFRVRIIYDMHDLSVETFKGKNMSKSWGGKILLFLLSILEKISLKLCNLVIATNMSIKDYAKGKTRREIYIVRNSNLIQFHNIEEVRKTKVEDVLILGYFGVIANDEAAGLKNFLIIADYLVSKKINFRIQVVGDGPGLKILKETVISKGYQDFFHFFGFVPLQNAFGIIKNFDFGLVTWGNIPKNNLHTAMKIMDYMCCAVPVCSLQLKEQINSTQNIGIHADSFEGIAELIILTFSDSSKYEKLRLQTLLHFNNHLSWENQEKTLLLSYSAID